MINRIAIKAKSLDLNAAVEAARAGEQGRGVAVVAGEVRNLDSRRAGAAQGIEAVIRDSVLPGAQGRPLGQATGATIGGTPRCVPEVPTIVQPTNT
ncbi:methyl-accepting chemotaxis protein, partial [Salmonella enterica]|uniref:methyl-accepting chemotaxis protein n=1 Tax=Salmonella enterica TaxID=28901 RepID=UPI00398C4015